MHVELFVLSVLLLGFALWLKFGGRVQAAARPVAKPSSPTRPVKTSPRPKHHNSPEYQFRDRQARAKTNRENLERWQNRARRELLP